MIRRFFAWLRAQVPTDEQLGAAPENDAQIRARMNELESLRAIARQRVAELQERNTTTSPIHRRSA